jgi:hypothetical protein
MWVAVCFGHYKYGTTTTERELPCKNKIQPSERQLVVTSTTRPKIFSGTAINNVIKYFQILGDALLYFRCETQSGILEWGYVCFILTTVTSW